MNESNTNVRNYFCMHTLVYTYTPTHTDLHTSHAVSSFLFLTWLPREGTLNFRDNTEGLWTLLVRQKQLWEYSSAHYLALNFLVSRRVSHILWKCQKNLSRKDKTSTSTSYGFLRSLRERFSTSGWDPFGSKDSSIGVTYQVSCISDIYTAIYNSSNITVMKWQWNNFKAGVHHNMRSCILKGFSGRKAENHRSEICSLNPYASETTLPRNWTEIPA